MGGEITWVCLGTGQYQFDLVLYRDCNGLDIVDPFLDLEVWDHPTVSSIQCDLVGTSDLSPNCTQVVPAYPELDCGVGSQGGNGPGAVQKFTYRSAPVTLAGTPPAGGWKFTYDSFSRNWSLSNIDSPQSYGITLSAYMFATPNGTANPCTDSSPQFAQDPYMLVCNGTNVSYDANAYDPDNDSLVYSWGVPLDHFPAGAFDPPTNPAPVPFVAGYAFNNPTPDATFNGGNVAANMDPITGNISFLSNNNGNFGIVQKINSYRDGQLVSTIHREFQMIIIDCIGYNNNPPVITPTFAGGTTFDTTIFAGDLINFDIIITDNELLQDGTPQTVTLNPTGNYFGTNLIDPNSGCDYTPCATLDQAPVISGVQGVTANFDWQTSCDHLLDANGVQQAEQTYSFVLNAQDDYCTVPGRTYETIRITLKNQPEVAPVDLHCVDVLPNGDVDLTWTQTTDPGGSFVEYQVWSEQSGYIATVPGGITTENYTVVGAGADLASIDFFIMTRYGCGGNNLASSDTLSSIFLNLNDLGDGRIHLTWNSMADPQNGGDAIMEEVWREYPAGTWTLRGTVPYGTNELIDTIDVCNADMAYEIRIPSSAGCTSTSNDPSGNFSDIINPYIPILHWVTIDTVSGFVEMCWTPNAAPDTYGYEIYGLISGFWTPIDTVWGINTTCYTHVLHSADIAPASYRITAFDSCLTNAVPATYQTSALSPQHTTVFSQTAYDICEKDITIDWTPYGGWVDGVDHYDVIASVGASPYDIIATVGGTESSYKHTGLTYDLNYCYYIRSVGVNDSISYSNKVCRYTDRPSEAQWHYLAAASYNLGNEVEILTYTDGSASVNSFEAEVNGPFDTQFDLLSIIQPNGTDWIQYDHTDVEPDAGAYEYQVSLIDSCGNVGFVSNVAKTVYLQVEVDHVTMQNVLSWTAYEGFDGGVGFYNIYRGEDGVFTSTPIGSTSSGVRSFVDDVSSELDSEGQFCYRVEAVEEMNSYGFAQTAFSNNVCATIAPLVYIPNAFIVNSHNPVFKPVLSLYEFDSYKLEIFDRWGQIIYTTDNPDEGWGGQGPGNGLVSEGTYIYMLTFEDRDAKEYVYRGHVTMLIYEP